MRSKLNNLILKFRDEKIAHVIVHIFSIIIGLCLLVGWVVLLCNSWGWLILSPLVIFLIYCYMVFFEEGMEIGKETVFHEIYLQDDIYELRNVINFQNKYYHKVINQIRTLKYIKIL